MWAELFGNTEDLKYLFYIISSTTINFVIKIVQP